MERSRRGSKDPMTRHSSLGDPTIFMLVNVQIAVMESNIELLN